MTRKTCINHSHVHTVLQTLCSKLSRSDYCREALDQRKSLGNLLDINDLCEANVTTELLLNSNGLELNNKQLDNIKLLLLHIAGPMTRNKMPRTRTSSMCYKVKNSPLSPTGSDFGHRLRTRRYTSFVSSYVDTSGDDDSNHIRPMRELRSSHKASPNKSSDQEQNVWDSGRPKRTCIKHKHTSADERLVADNKNYYKVEVMTNKLRSSSIPNKEPEPPAPKKIKSPPVSEESEDDKGLIVKFRKLRNSELTRLNNEAENFLFPRKDESSSEEDTDVDVNPTPVSNKKNSALANDSSSKLKICKTEPEEESSMDSMASEISIKKRRRLTQAEAFILDNQRYYKFETPGSRLRYQGSYLAPVASKNNGEYFIKQPRSREIVDVKPKLKLEDLKFAFEVVPKNEPWYKTFQRQDIGEECYSCYHYSSGYNQPFLLPYEMGPLPPLDPRNCVYAYNQMKKRYFGEPSAACSTPDSSSADASGKTDYTSSTGEDTKSSEDSTVGSEFAESFFQKSKLISKQGHSRRGAFSSSKNPRKSPRQHASTLAILSSLIQQRKRRELHKSRGSDQNSSRHNLSAIAEEDKAAQELDYDTVAKNISDMLSNSVDQMGLLEVSISGDGVDVDVHHKPDVIATLEDYINCKSHVQSDIELPPVKVNLDGSAVRKPCRKKKKNRTGWPNKHRRPVFRKEGSDSRDGLAGSEHENSIIDSPSIHADSEGNEENSEDNNCNKRNSKNVSLSKLSSFIQNTITPKKEGRSANNSKINGDVQANKLNGVNDNFELNFKSLGTPRRKEHRESSSDNCAEVVIASVGDKIECVNVDLAKWETAERVLAAKLRSEAINNDIQFQPIVRVQKLDSDAVKRSEKRSLSPTPKRMRPRRMPASPKSPRMLRRPRGGWYRERY